MSTNDSPGCECIAPDDRLPPAIGVDADGLVHHVAAGFANTAILTDGDAVVSEYNLPAHIGRDEWVAEVRETRGWADCWADERLPAREIEQRIAEAQR